MAADDAFDAWFRLLETPGLGRTKARSLLAACGSPEAVLCTPLATLRELAGAGLARALTTEPPAHAERLAAARAWLAGGDDRRTLALGEPGYPEAWLQTADPPLLLYLQGDPSRLAAPRQLAVVGSRQASAQGLDTARAFARALAAEGWCIVSGLAAGIDGAAHEGALAAGTAGAGTVAIVGTGLDTVYPPRHAGLARRIAAQGLLLSEHAPGTPALAEHFPQRNRLIAGLAQGTLVVEATLRSGSLITARLAAECGREVFAVPGSIHSPHARGCHALIKQGAKLVESADDVLDELRGSTGARTLVAASESGEDGETGRCADRDAPLLAALGHDPTTLDALQARSGWSTAELNARLLELELDGRVARLPGGLFQRRGSA